MVKVNSTVVESYENVDGVGLVVELKNGSKYAYPSVSRSQLKAFEEAESKGKFFNKVLRKLESRKL